MSEHVVTVRPREDGGIDLVGLSDVVAGLVLSLADALAEDEAPEVRSRLFPDVSDDDRAANEEWRRLVHPELFHLLASAREVIAEDLRALSSSLLRKGSTTLEIPGKHRDAWISGLQAARLALGARHGLDVYDPDPPPPGRVRERLLVELRMALFADLMWELVNGASRDLADDT